MRTLPLILLLLAPPALAQEAKVVRDGWWATWVGPTKTRWGHERVEERPSGFVIVDRSWRVVGSDALLETEERTETDAAGKVLRETRQERSPWGAADCATVAEAGGLAYEVKVRALPPVKGTIEGDVWSPAITSLLAMRGAQPPGKRTLRVLAIPGKGAKDEAYEVKRDGAGWVVTHDDGSSWHDASGRHLRARRTEYAAEITLAAASEAEARDRAAKAPAGVLPAVDLFEGPGLRLKRPAGPGWSLMSKADEKGMKMFGVEHASNALCVAMSLPMQAPSDPEALLDLARAMREGMNKEADDVEGPRLGEPTSTTWRDRRAARYALEGRMAMQPVAGEAFLVAADGGLLLVMLASPADLAETCRPELRAASAALELVAAGAAPWERVTFPGGSVELPKGWKTGPAQERISPLGASRVSLTRGPTPAMDLHEAQRLWAGQQERNKAIESFEVVRDEELKVGGQPVTIVEWTGRIKENKGVRAKVRSLSCVARFDDGHFAELVVVVFDLDFDLDAVERLLESVRWKAQAAEAH